MRVCVGGWRESVNGSQIDENFPILPMMLHHENCTFSHFHQYFSCLNGCFPYFLPRHVASPHALKSQRFASPTLSPTFASVHSPLVTMMSTSSTLLRAGVRAGTRAMSTAGVRGYAWLQPLRGCSYTLRVPALRV